MPVNTNKDGISSRIAKVNGKTLGAEVGMISNQWSIPMEVFMPVCLHPFLFVCVFCKLRLLNCSVSALMLELFHLLSGA